ncbi:MAG: spore coat protein, partial [Armatimonadota bacterium]
GAYMYDELVWDILPELTPSGRGELEITDVNNAYLERGLLTADVLECDWGDAGRSADYLFEATVIARRNDLLSEFEGLRGATDE